MRPEMDSPKGSPRFLLWISLLVTFGLVYWQWSAEQEGAEELPIVSDVTLVKSARQITPTAAPSETAAPEQTTTVNPKSAPAVVVAATSSTVLPRNLPATKDSQPLFAAHEWLPPPPKPEPPPPPQAPPLPFTYVGSMQDVPDGNTIILMQQKKVLMPKLGGQVNAQWRLDREDAQSLYFTYVPLNKTVVLSKSKTAAAGNQRQAAAEVEDNNSFEVPNP